MCVKNQNISKSRLQQRSEECVQQNIMHECHINFVQCSYHSSALAVADVWIQPSNGAEDASKPWNASAVNITEASVAGHCSQQILNTHTYTSWRGIVVS